MKLQELKVIYICPEHNEKYQKRKAHMQALLEKNRLQRGHTL